MKKVSTPFPEVWIIEPDVFPDNRGFFFESYSYQKFLDLGIDTTFVQDNHSKSSQNTVRGLHFQAYPGQIKLIRCTRGTLWDVIVDIRPESPTFRQWFGVELSEENYQMVYIPLGFAHGFSVLSEDAEMQYKVSNYYNPAIERGVRYDDPTINVDWKVEQPVLSNRDLLNPTLNEYLEQHSEPFEP